MNYQKIHDAIINRARDIVFDSTTHFKHHIIPRHEDPTSTELVFLTFKEHYIVHLLRWKFVGTVGNLKAYKLMRGMSFDPKIISANAGKIGGATTKIREAGIFSPDWDRAAETRRRWEDGIISTECFSLDDKVKAGHASVESGKGIHSPDWDHSATSTKMWADLTPDEYEERRQKNEINAKKGGQRSKELGTNFSSWDPAKRHATCSKGGKVSGKMPCWTNGIISKKAWECPGDGWFRGRIIKGKVYPRKENI